MTFDPDAYLDGLCWPDESDDGVCEDCGGALFDGSCPECKGEE